MTTPPLAVEVDDLGVARAEGQLAAHLDAVRRAFGAEGMGVIDLPPLTAGRLVGPQIAVGAVLYWAWELEQAGLLPFVERLGAALLSGRVPDTTSGQTARRLIESARATRPQFRAPERAALFARLFGAPGAIEPVEPFLPLFTAFVDALRNLAAAPLGAGVGPDEARVRVLAAEVGALVSDRCAGIAAFAARDITDQIRAALRLLAAPDVSRTLGGGPVASSPLAVLTRHGPAVLGRPTRPAFHLPRAVHGNRVLGWMAREAAAIEAGSVHLDRGQAVFTSAAAWRASGGGP